MKPELPFSKPEPQLHMTDDDRGGLHDNGGSLVLHDDRGGISDDRRGSHIIMTDLAVNLPWTGYPGIL